MEDSVINLSWVKCTGEGWCPLLTVNLEKVTAEGVYIIWHGGNPSRIVRVGQGIIADRLADHRDDPAILAHKSKGTWYVTWAALPAHQRDAVEAHLTQTWVPLVGDRFPDALPLTVNSPWS